MSSAPDSSFAPRPWPKRAPDASPLAGRRILLLDGDDALAAQVEAVLERASCTARRLAPQAALEELGHAGWEVLIAVGLDAEFSDTLAGLADAPPLIVIASEQDGEAQAWPPGVFAQLAGVPTDAQLLTTLGRALEQSLLQRENRDLRASLAGRYQLGNVMTRDPVLKDVLKTIETVADTRASVLLSGESGTGKTLLAHALHQHSSRASGPFVVVNCGSLPDTLLESELFGHVRGAFTGAVRDKLGRFEQADGGTLFLDEINSASLDLQVKLLRAIQDRTFERVGDSTTRSADVRIVTASNRDLEQEVAEGRFREDLYYRIHVVNLQLPPLRERSGDIALLAEHFLERAARTYDKAFDGITPPRAARSFSLARKRAPTRERDRARRPALERPRARRGRPRRRVRSRAAVRCDERHPGAARSARDPTATQGRARGARTPDSYTRPRAERGQSQRNGRDARHQPHDALQQNEEVRLDGPLF